MSAVPLDAASAIRLETLAGTRGLRRGLAARDTPAVWGLDALAGRLAEVSGLCASSALSLVFRLVLEAQKRKEPVAWISRKESVFYPPDVAEGGVDLEALAVVWARGTRPAARAADLLVRSGAFGLVVLDIGVDDRMPRGFETRLAGLAHQHETALLCITEKDSCRSSLGSLVSLRAEAGRARGQGERFHCELRVIKDKRRGPGWTHVEECHGPDGLC